MIYVKKVSETKGTDFLEGPKNSLFNNLQESGRVHFLENCLTELELMPGVAPSSLDSCLACTESTLSETVTLSSSGR